MFNGISLFFFYSLISITVGTQMPAFTYQKDIF